MILIVYGTRPELIKIRPLVKAFKNAGIDYKLLFTGQHADLAKYDHDYAMVIKNGDNRLDSIVSSVCDGVLSRIKTKEYISYVLVQGDTTTAMAVALSAFNNGIKIAHLEAGLRTYDKANPYPEEQNRRIISQLADLHFCPTQLNKNNLENECIKSKKYITGNTVLDNLEPYKDKCHYGKDILVTMHRRENHANIKEWFEAINRVAKYHPQFNFVIPLHPNPEVQKHSHILTNLEVVEPMDYSDLLNFLTGCTMVITDSGGIQEECSFFNKKCLVCRKTTERPETLGTTSFLVGSPDKLEKIFAAEIITPKVSADCPFGNGHASEYICDLLLNILKDTDNLQDVKGETL